MKGAKMISGGLVILALIFAFNVPGASAQILDGVWFKIIVEGQGKAVDLADDELLGNEEFKLKVFAQFIWDGGANEYVYDMYIKGEQGEWEYWDRFPIDADELFSDPDENWAMIFNGVIDFLNLKKPLMIVMYHTSLIKIDKKTSGDFKYAKIKSLGSHCYATQDMQTYVFGSCKMTGESIEESDLPFTPITP
ncbi:MAG: hypothetical protein JRJ14_09320 [Deltaproteobacteria bacterium]|nr:hypothetical protein [Deltaproteobacteria bacterium]